jgi:hypothetical protein
MMAVLLIVGIGFLLMGLLGIVFGIPVKEFSFGNTLILAGALSACTGTVLLGLWMVVRELRNIARRLGGDLATESRAETKPPTAGVSAPPGNQAAEGGAFLFSRDQPAAGNAAAQSWHEEAGSRDGGRGAAPSPPEPAEADPAVKPRRNLMFSSSSRKERERAQAKAAEPVAADVRSPPATSLSPLKSGEAAPTTFDDAWPQSERSSAVDEPPSRRRGRAPSTFAEPPPAARNEDQPTPVTVLKSGVVDGMAYTLYSDGSIEAQMPEGMMRFASIDELRSHLDQ